jgi:hypothetical protein
LDPDALYFVEKGIRTESIEPLCLLTVESPWESCEMAQTACNKHIKTNNEDLIM